MRIIIIEDIVFKVTEKQFKEIKEMESEIDKNGYQPDNELKKSEFFEENIPTYRKIGMIDYHFQL